jgi:L-rhamnose isomerase
MSIDLRKYPTDVLQHVSEIVHADEDHVVVIEVGCVTRASNLIHDIRQILCGVMPEEIDAEIRRRAN